MGLNSFLSFVLVALALPVAALELPQGGIVLRDGTGIVIIASTVQNAPSVATATEVGGNNALQLPGNWELSGSYPALSFAAQDAVQAVAAPAENAPVPVPTPVVRSLPENPAVGLAERVRQRVNTEESAPAIDPTDLRLQFQSTLDQLYQAIIKIDEVRPPISQPALAAQPLPADGSIDFGFGLAQAEAAAEAAEVAEAALGDLGFGDLGGAGEGNDGTDEMADLGFAVPAAEASEGADFAPGETGLTDDLVGMPMPAELRNPPAPAGPALGPFLSYDADAFFRDLEAELLERLTDPLNRLARNRVRGELAELYAVYQRPLEALSVLQQVDEKSPRAALIQAVAHYEMNQPAQTLQALLQAAEWPAELDDHATVWQAAALTKVQNPVTAIPLFAQSISPTVNHYPPELRESIWLTYAQANFDAGNFAGLNEVLEVVKSLQPDSKELPALGKLLLAQAALQQEDFPTVERLLGEVANETSLPVAYQAQFQFVNYLLSQGDLSPQIALGHLEDLRRLWRGGDLERDLLYQLGHMYRDAGQIREALTRWRTLTTYFPDDPVVDEIALKMTNLFMQSFRPPLVDQFDDLGVLGLYYDFRELTAPGAAGDRLILFITQELQDVSLLERAILALRLQIDTRTDDPQLRAELGNRLAELYLAAEQPDEGLQVLVQTVTTPLPAAVANKRAEVRGDLLNQQERWQEATAAVDGISSRRAQQTRIDAAWGEGDMPRVAELLKEKFVLGNLPLEWGLTEQLNAQRYMLASHRLQRPDDLLDFRADFKPQLSDTGLLHPTDIVLNDLGVLADEFTQNREDIYASTATQLAFYEDFQNTYRLLRAQRQEEIRMRQYFNWRNRQPSASMLR